MTISRTTIPPDGLVLVTGANGLLASHIASTLLGMNYRVRGTVRSADKAAWLTSALSTQHPSSSSSFSTIIVPDVTAPGAWSAAVQSVDGIVHVIGDMSFSPDPNKVITTILDSLQALLAAAAQQPSIKRFVLTSSNRALTPPLVNEPLTITKDMLNTSAVEKAWAPPPYNADRTWDVYSAQKTQGEQKLWTFSREAQPKFVVNTVLPCYVTGPIIHPSQAGSTARIALVFFRNPTKPDFLQGFGASWFVDVHDTALLHVAALTQEDVKNERLLGFTEPFNFNTWQTVFRQLNPSKSWPADDPDQNHDLTKVDSTREVELLKRFGQPGWTSFYDSVRQNCFNSHVE